jgi:hypothetical protein
MKNICIYKNSYDWPLIVDGRKIPDNIQKFY